MLELDGGLGLLLLGRLLFEDGFLADFDGFALVNGPVRLSEDFDLFFDQAGIA